MSLAEALVNAAAKPRLRCGTAKVRHQLDPDGRAILDQALTSDMDNAQIARALASMGHRIAGQSIGRHRNGVCNCEPV